MTRRGWIVGAVALAAAGCATAKLPAVPAGAPKLIRAPMPEYPDDVKRAGLQGTVEISYGIAPDGSAQDLRVEKSANPTLDGLALAAVARWRHESPRPGASPRRLKVPLTFTLTQRGGTQRGGVVGGAGAPPSTPTRTP